MPNEMIPIVEEYFKKVSTQYEIAFAQAALEIEEKKLGPLEAYILAMGKVEEMDKKLAAALSLGEAASIYYEPVDEKVAELLEPYIKGAEEVLKGMILETFQSETLEDALENNKQLQATLKIPAIADHLDLFAGIKLNGDQKH